MASGTGVGVGAGTDVGVGVGEGTSVGVGVGARVGATVGIGVGLGVAVGTTVAVGVGATVAVGGMVVGNLVGVSVGLPPLQAATINRENMDSDMRLTPRGMVLIGLRRTGLWVRLTDCGESVGWVWELGDEARLIPNLERIRIPLRTLIIQPPTGGSPLPPAPFIIVWSFNHFVLTGIVQGMSV